MGSAKVPSYRAFWICFVAFFAGLAMCLGGNELRDVESSETLSSTGTALWAASWAVMIGSVVPLLLLADSILGRVKQSEPGMTKNASRLLLLLSIVGGWLAVALVSFFLFEDNVLDRTQGFLGLPYWETSLALLAGWMLLLAALVVGVAGPTLLIRWFPINPTGFRHGGLALLAVSLVCGGLAIVEIRNSGRPLSSPSSHYYEQALSSAIATDTAE